MRRGEMGDVQAGGVRSRNPANDFPFHSETISLAERKAWQYFGQDIGQDIGQDFSRVRFRDGMTEYRHGE